MKNKSYVGIILVLLGFGFLLDQFNVISFNNIINTYWPVILIVIGIYGLLNRSSSKMVSSIITILGALFLIQNLNILNISVYKLFWPIVLIIVGLSFIFSKNRVFVNRSHSFDSEDSSKNISLQDHVNESVLLSGIETSMESQEFKGGKLSCILGGIELDLRGAKLHDNEATIDINVFMGGVEIYVPEDWNIEHRGTPILGGMSKKRRFVPEEYAPVLKVNFTVIMGGIDIK